jgi:PDZ domain-containing secreted protein
MSVLPGHFFSVPIEGRQRVRNQLHLMAPGEYGPVQLTGSLSQSGKGITPTLPDGETNFDIAVLATMMGIPKEGPSAGITIVAEIVSALTGRRVRNDLTMTGEITGMGKVLAIGPVLPKLQAAIDAGCKEGINPSDESSVFRENALRAAPNEPNGKLRGWRQTDR